MHVGRTRSIASPASTRRLQKLAGEPLLASVAAEVSSEDAGPDSWSCTDLPAPTVTEHEMADGTAYTATAGLLPIVLEETEGAKGSIFFAAYTLSQPAGDTPRPLTFLFNGGPGSSSIWLHLSGIGPKMVELLPDGGQPAPPYALVDSGDACWLPHTDLVFIDAMGAGYSRPTTVADGPKFWGVQEDLDSFTEFMRCYLNTYNRWLSPLYLAGESYGTFRSAGLASSALAKAGISFSGIFLVSSVLALNTIWEAKSANHLPAMTFIPTFAATAWYHHKLSPELQGRELADVVEEVSEWTLTTYAVAMAKGERMSADETASVASELAKYTGLSEEFVLQSNLRIDDGNFRKELLRSDRHTIGRMDARYVGFDRNATGAVFQADPSTHATKPAFVACFHDYIKSELQYSTDRKYYLSASSIPGFKWNYPTNAMGDTSEMLRAAISANPYMRVVCLNGYYDLATPFFGTEYTFAHLDLEPELRDNISMEYYTAGHMFYTDRENLFKLAKDAARFFAAREYPRAVVNVPGRAPK